MTAANKKIAEDTPGDIEALLPWHAAGTLNARDTRRVEEALSRGTEYSGLFLGPALILVAIYLRSGIEGFFRKEQP